MAKKKNNPMYFNLFEADQFDKNKDQISEITEDSSESSNSFVSIAEFKNLDSKDFSDSDAAQTTLFENESFFNFFSNDEPATNELTEKNSVVSSVTSEKNTVPDNDIENTSSVVKDFEEVEEVDEVISDALIEDVPPTSDFYVETEVQCSESTLDEIQSTKTEELLLENNSIISYEEIKNNSVQYNFELPFTFHGKNGDRIRYRLFLPSENKPKHNRLKRSTMSWFLTIAVAFIIAMLLRTFVFVIATVDGPSMLPTLENKEKLFVTKYTYAFSEIKRGDVVICKYGTEIYPDNYVKRVIGLSGEMISIHNGVVYINGIALEEKYILEPMLSDMEPVYVPEDCVFVMGDNRNNSADSRKNIVGPIKKDLIIGKAQFIIAPFDKIGSLEVKK